MDHPFISTLLRSGPVGQTILAGLLVLSVYTWTVIFSKTVALRSAERQARAFLARFRESGHKWVAAGGAGAAEGPCGALYDAGIRELETQIELARGGALDADALERVEAALETETVDRIAELERGHLVLAVAASASPFIGLFGTVWGIMNAFRGMSAEGSAGIAAVAPGVAEALVTTVAGLAVAIPAVVAYNMLNRKVQLITAVLDRFSAEFARAADAVARRGARPAPGVRESRPGEEAPVFARRNV